MRIKGHYTEKFEYKLNRGYGEVVQAAANEFLGYRTIYGFDFSGLSGRAIVRKGNTVNSLVIILDMNVAEKVLYYFWMSGNLVALFYMFPNAIRYSDFDITTFVPLILIIIGFIMFTLISISNAMIYKEKFEKFLIKHHYIKRK